LDDWYKNTGRKLTELIKDNGGSRIIAQHGSIINALAVLYPEHSWNSVKFVHKSRHYWKDKKNQLKFLEDFAKQNNVLKKDDWYGISSSQVRQAGGTVLLRYYNNSLLQALREIYPDHFWKDLPHFRFNKGSSKAQVALQNTIVNLLPETQMLVNFRHPELNRLEYDIFLPQLSLAFEYQGETHYHPTIFGSYLQTIKNDNKKVQISNKIGVTLIPIPYWWNKSIPFLINQLRKYRPDIQIVAPIDEHQEQHLPSSTQRPRSLFNNFKLNNPVSYSGDQIHPVT